jgi:hypothetical protein
MSRGKEKETLQPIAADDQVALVADYVVIALELDEKLGYSRPKRPPGQPGPCVERAR